MMKSILSLGLAAGLLMVSSTSLTGCLTDDKKPDSQAKSDSTPMGAESILTVGAQGNTSYGSALDLDAKKVLKSSEANAAQSTLDLLFVYSGGGLQIASPLAAKEAGDVPLAANYDTTKVKDTQIARISTEPVSSQVAATTFDATPKSDMTYALEGGEYLVKTGEGKIAYVRIVSITGDGDTASATIAVALSGI